MTPHDKKILSLGRMTRGMIHDFNNSLASMMGYADFLTSDLEQGSEQHQFAVNIKLAGAQMQHLLGQLRTMALSVDENKLPPLSVRTETTQLCRDVTSVLPPTYNLDLQSDNADTKIKLHPYQFHVLLMNIINNAIDALPENGGDITVRISRKKPRARKWPKVKDESEVRNLLPLPDGKDILYLTIDDTGCGIKTDILDKIFEPYFTSKTDRHAHGIGLTIVKDILEQIGAGLSVETVAGHGTRIGITFQVAAEKP